ncbi:hypothetical protein [Aliidiomarina maris]|uniref:Minor curlin subunit n=1 Tax=Aliidiomarina maris TaxID=531312 RepID=A0A327X4A0_9GAMM|nr:hypothetical protein [Aliidiomarina maris]RAK01561.1 hypothetical protein B0I24_101184 [Aliidiomarina maris]RUO28395.1 hypothetical protein CWE07_00895 [Aliidiomarina maris]
MMQSQSQNTSTAPFASVRKVAGIAGCLFAFVACMATASADTSIDNDMDVAPTNHVNLMTLVEDQQLDIAQYGELNSIQLLINAQNVTVQLVQQGSQHSIAGVQAGSAANMSGANSQLFAQQQGFNHQLFVHQASDNSRIQVAQLGSGNQAFISQR